MAENNRESNMRVSLLKTCVKKTLKWDLEMQSTRLLLLLCVFLSFLFFICYSLLSAPEKKKKKKEQSRLWENIKDLAPRTKPLLGIPVNQKLSQCNSLKDDFFLFADDISDRTITHLSPGCAKNCQRDVRQSIWDTAALILCRDETHVEREKDKTKREKGGLLNLISDKRPLRKPFLSPAKWILWLLLWRHSCYKLSPLWGGTERFLCLGLVNWANRKKYQYVKLHVLTLNCRINVIMDSGWTCGHFFCRVWWQNHVNQDHDHDPQFTAFCLNPWTQLQKGRPNWRLAAQYKKG